MASRGPRDAALDALLKETLAKHRSAPATTKRLARARTRTNTASAAGLRPARQGVDSRASSGSGDGHSIVDDDWEPVPMAQLARATAAAHAAVPAPLVPARATAVASSSSSRVYGRGDDDKDDQQDACGDRGAESAVAALPPGAEDEWGGLTDSELFNVPDDMHVTLARLHQLFPEALRSAGCPSLVLQAQLYAILHDRTIADRHVDRLQRCGRLRVIRLATGDGAVAHYALVNQDAFVASISAACAAASSTPTAIPTATPTATATTIAATTETSSSHEAADVSPSPNQPTTVDPHHAAAGAAPVLDVVTRFVQAVVPASKDVSITQHDLVSKLYPDSTYDFATGRPSLRMRTLSRAMRQEHDRINADLTTLMRLGILVQRDTFSYWFGVPGVGRFLAAFQTGRRLVLRALRAAGFQELLVSEIERRLVGKTVLPALYIVYDLVGEGLVDLHATKRDGLLVRLSSSYAATLSSGRQG